MNSHKKIKPTEQPELPIEELEERVVTEAQEWVLKSKQSRMINLPSGVTVKIRKLRLLEYAINGSLPIPTFYKCLKTAESLTNLEAWKDINQDDLSGLIELVRKIVIVVVAEPKVSETEGEVNTIYVGDIPEEDLFEIFAEAMGGQQTPLASFR